jgi:hypothetical protein
MSSGSLPKLIQLVIMMVDVVGITTYVTYIYLFTNLIGSLASGIIPVLNSSPASKLEIFTCNGW